MSRISSLDAGYLPGMLSVYPEAKDSKDTLYEAKNNAITILKQSVTYSGKIFVANDASGFPDAGLIRIGPPPGQPGSAELVYYGKKTNTTFQSLLRGFAGSRQNQWPAGSWVTNAVMAEHHNAVKDAIIQIQKNLGLLDFPEAESLNGILKELEIRFLAPRPLFRAFPLKGPSPLKVKFQNFSGGEPLRFLWDFGDGGTSVDESPVHLYQAEGLYTVKLNMITSTGAQGIATKSNYISVNDDEKTPFFYALPTLGYSVDTAAARTLAGNPTSPTTFTLVDQTDGRISERFWSLDDGTSTNETDPNIHTLQHQYQKPGVYEPSLLVIFSSSQLKRSFLTEKITVL